MNITVLCKVVDNFGDIGVVYRMIKQLRKDFSQHKIFLVIDDFSAFNKINHEVDESKSLQIIDGVFVYNWNDYDLCYKDFSDNDGEKLSVILECFQCGRPEWMEKILFEDKLNRTVHVIMIDYLTAEDYAESFHCLQSLTRSAKVQKVNFMPGFTEKTGGLIIDEDWKYLPEYNENGNVLIFTYERNWTGLAKALFDYVTEDEKNIKICIAQGRGKESFFEAWEKVAGSQNNLVLELPYLNQNEWDSFMKKCSLLVIRGEESMSRACLSGIPFIWHAYPQSDEYQMVKVQALLTKLEPFFTEKQFEIIKDAWLAINESETEITDSGFEKKLYDFFSNRKNLVAGFAEFAKSLRKNGDLVHKLMTFIDKNIIM